MRKLFIQIILLYIYILNIDVFCSNDSPFKLITYYNIIYNTAIQIQLDRNSNILYYQYEDHNVEFSSQFKLEDICFNKIIEHFMNIDFAKIDSHYSGDYALDGGFEKLTIDLPQKTLEISGLGYEDEPKELKTFSQTLLQCTNKYLEKSNTHILKQMKYNYLLNHKKFIDSLYSSRDTISYYSAVEQMPKLLNELNPIKTEKCNKSIEEGSGIAQLYIDENGVVKKVIFLKGYGNYCEESAIEKLLNIRFEPGKQRGKSVKVKMTMKIYFN